MDKILSGKPIAQALRERLTQAISESGIVPRMQLIQVGEDPASSYYVQSIVKSGAKLGCEVVLITKPEDFEQDQLLQLIDAANSDSNVDGIMIQKPLPAHIDTNLIDLRINPAKDIDGIHPMNLGKILIETDVLVPCTAKAVLKTLQHYNIDPSGRQVVILGRSTVLGKPLANLLLQKKPFANATVTVCHSKTIDLASVTRNADILVAAIGRAEYVKQEMIKENSILIDVGINLITNAHGKAEYVGDIDYKVCFDKALAITPVPGGIGTITTTILFENLVQAAFLNRNLNKSIDDFS